MSLSYTPAQLYGMLSNNCNCLNKITYDSNYLYFTGLQQDAYGVFVDIPVLKNFTLEYDLTCIISNTPNFNPTFGSINIPTHAQNYGFMVSFTSNLEIWKGYNLSSGTNSTIANSINTSTYNNAVANNVTAHIKIQRDGGTISVYVDNTLLQTVTSNYVQDNVAGYFGFFNWNGNNCKIANYTINSPELPSTGDHKYLDYTGLQTLVTDIINYHTAHTVDAYSKTEIDNMLLNYYRNDGFGISSFGLSYFGGRE